MTYTAEWCAECKGNLTMYVLRSASRVGVAPKRLDWDRICQECHEGEVQRQAENAKWEERQAAEYEWRCFCGFRMPVAYSELPYRNHEAWRCCPFCGGAMLRMQIGVIPDDDGKARELERQSAFNAQHNHDSHRARFTGRSPN
jgi:hypothetical protein